MSTSFAIRLLSNAFLQFKLAQTVCLVINARVEHYANTVKLLITMVYVQLFSLFQKANVRIYCALTNVRFICMVGTRTVFVYRWLWITCRYSPPAYKSICICTRTLLMWVSIGPQELTCRSNMQYILGLSIKYQWHLCAVSVLLLKQYWRKAIMWNSL